MISVEWRWRFDMNRACGFCFKPVETWWIIAGIKHNTRTNKNYVALLCLFPSRSCCMRFRFYCLSFASESIDWQLNEHDFIPYPIFLTLLSPHVECRRSESAEVRLKFDFGSFFLHSLRFKAHRTCVFVYWTNVYDPLGNHSICKICGWVQCARALGHE